MNDHGSEFPDRISRPASRWWLAVAVLAALLCLTPTGRLRAAGAPGGFAGHMGGGNAGQQRFGRDHGGDVHPREFGGGGHIDGGRFGRGESRGDHFEHRRFHGFRDHFGVFIDPTLPYDDYGGYEPDAPYDPYCNPDTTDYDPRYCRLIPGDE